MKRWLVGGFLGMCLSGNTLKAERLGVHPDAPAQTAQFAFLVGDWSCAVKGLTPDGKSTIETTASWSGRYVLGGWAIQDHWYSKGPSGVGGWGTNIRWWNTEISRWENQWLQTRANRLSHFYADQVGETMVMIGGEGDSPFGPFVDRNTFFDIDKDAWRWRKDRSFDGGESWIENVSTMLCERVSASERDPVADGAIP